MQRSQQGSGAGWYSHPERPGEMWYWDGTAWTESRWASQPPARKIRAQQDPRGFLRDLAAMLILLGVLAIAVWAGDAWTGMNVGDTLELPGMIGIPIVVFGVVLAHWLGREDSADAVPARRRG